MCEEIMVKNDLRSMKYINPHDQEAQRTTIKINNKQTSQLNTSAKLLKMKDKEKILVAKGKRTYFL